MPSFSSSLLTLITAFAAANAEHLRVVFSSGGFSSISGPNGGSVTGHYDDFAVINDDGVAIYADGSPDSHSPCFNTDGGRTFTIQGSCWKSPRTFHCLADFGGNPESCEVRDADGKVLGKGEGQTDTTFIGISIGTDSSCVVEFHSEDTDGKGCPKDNGDSPLHASSE